MTPPRNLGIWELEALTGSIRYQQRPRYYQQTAAIQFHGQKPSFSSEGEINICLLLCVRFEPRPDRLLQTLPTFEFENTKQ